MARRECKEPGSGGPYVVRANAGDQLVFPHVDSCLAVVFVLSNGDLIGGHVGIQWGGGGPRSNTHWENYASPDPLGNAKRVIREMNMLHLPEEMIVRLISLCDLAGQDPIWQLGAIYAGIVPMTIPHMILDSRNATRGIDLTVNGQLSTVTAARWQNLPSPKTTVKDLRFTTNTISLV
jgi:hypothetical protein